MNILLASLTTLPKLVNGKVCVINDDGTYSLYAPSRYISMNDGFNPMNYSILVSPIYKCVVYSTTKEKEEFLVNQQIRQMNLTVYRIGDKIHIHSRRGIYTIVGICDDYITITCNKWQYDKNPTRRIHKSEFCALAGGLHNRVFL